MLGAIIGDMVGSIYEFNPIKSKDFDIYSKKMHMSDDSFLTIAVAKVLMNHYPFDFSNLDNLKKDLIKGFTTTWKEHPYAGWGRSFNNWCQRVYIHGNASPYNSCGNGAAMRISPAGWLSKSEEEVKILSKAVTEITHNHIEGLKGAEATAMCIYLARHKYSKEQIKERMIKDYYPIIKDLDFDDLVKNYQFSELCQDSVPQAIHCFLVSNSLEDAIRNCIAIGGDSDTTAAIAGSIAEAFYKDEYFSPIEKIYLDTRIEKQYLPTIYQFYDLVDNAKI